MELEKQVVSLELAKKLKELGVKQESLFYWSQYTDDSNDRRWQIGYRSRTVRFNNEPLDWYCAFTVTELTAMMQDFYEEKIGRKVELPDELDKRISAGLFCMFDPNFQAQLLIFLIETGVINPHA